MNESELKSSISGKIVKTTIVVLCHPHMIHALEKDVRILSNFLLVNNSNQDVNKVYIVQDEDLERCYHMQAGRLM